tara:strand:- start:48 stop:2252 length:2205 start_codon:yes stop_codon:yes gene_type:complete
MSNTIRIKKRASGGGNTGGAPSSLAPSELAFNEVDLKLYYGFGDNGNTPPSASSIITVGGTGAFFDKATTRSANAILAGPTTGSAAAPTFRSLVAADIPSIAHTKISDFDTGVQTNRVDQLASATNPVTGVTPTADAHFATKGYVDGVAQGLDIKEAARVATTANITLSGTQTIDGVSVVADNRVLVKNQSTASQNGLYLCKASTWVRTDDLATGADASSVFVFISEGSTQADQGFVCSTDKGSAVVGTNNLTFTQFSGSGSITAGDGLDKSGNEFSVDLKANGGIVIESTEMAVDLSASSITGTLAVGDGGTGATSASAARTALGLAIGSNVQAFDAQLSDIAGLTPSDGNFIVGDGSNFVLESGSTARASLGLAIGTNVQAYDADLDNLSSMQSGASSALAAITSTELQILDGATVTTAELNLLDGVTATTSELNILDGVTATASELNILDGVTATATELNKLDGVTATTTELNYTDGVTSNIQTQLDAKQASNSKLTELATMGANTASALADLTQAEVQILDGASVTTSELNILDGVTATASEINLLDGVTATTAELNYTDGVSSNIQTQLDNKQALDADLTALSGCQSGAAAALALLTSTEVEILDGATLTTTELNYVDGVTSAIQTQLNNKQASDAQLTELATMASGTASALADLTGTEVGILDGATVTTTELNIMDGNTSATSTTLATADRMVMNDNGTMKQVALSDLVTFLEDGEDTSGFEVNGGTF